jgi:hypothetical protein
MATNKKKEAAALFELIDKSTLKVPKHAGALKIPDWWSSKTNPVTTAPPPLIPAKAAEEESASAKPIPGKQPRLFEPPADGTHPGAAPSIRPPSPSPPRTAVAPPPAAPSPPATTPSSADEPAPAPAVVKRPFLPQTMEQGGTNRPQWGGQQRRRMARTPKWAILAGLLGVVIVISLAAFLVLSGRQHSAEKANEVGTSTVRQASGDGGVTLLPPGAGRSQAPVPGNGGVQGRTRSLLPPSAPPAQPREEVVPTETGKVYGPGTVARSPELYYITITSTPTLSVAQKSADFLASKGVDVSIEIGKNHLYQLISVKGFPAVVEAEPYRKEIVKIGHEHPDFKKYRKVWDDAFIAHVKLLGK